MKLPIFSPRPTGSYLGRSVTAAVIAVAALCAVAPARAVIGTIDNVPAATLLLPYFEVSLSDPDGPQTSFSVVNTARAPTTVKVTLWTDYAVPSFHFDLYLGGRDTVEVDLGLLFTKGILPQTGSAIGTAGGLSDPHAVVASCSGILPPPSQEPAQIIDHLQKAHTGAASPLWGGQCGGAALNDNIARGYVTIDATNGCSLTMNPATTGYFAVGGTGVASNNNVLIGESKQINRTTKLAITEPLLSIEASSTSPVTTSYDLNPAGPTHDVRTAYTFYGRFVTGAADQREPLGSEYSARFFNGGLFPTGTTFTVWRDLDRATGQQGMPFVCSTPPAAMPQKTTVMFDEQERVFFPGGQTGVSYSQPLPGFQPSVFPRATQRVHTLTLNAPPFGWSLIDLNNGDVNNSYFNGARQGFVSAQYLSNGQWGGSINAKTLFNTSTWALKAGSTGCCGNLYAPSFPNYPF